MTFGALLIDLDGVLRIWEPERASMLEQRYGVPQGTLARAFRRELVSLPCTGACSHQEWMDRFAQEVSQTCARADALIAEWQAHRGLIDPAVLALVRELRQTVPVVLVSNATDWLERDLATLGLASEVDAVVNSSRLGVAKPEAAIYRHAAAVAGTTADRCVFVDDQPEHVEGARMVGMRAILYAGLDAMRRELASMGYLRPPRVGSVTMSVPPRPPLNPSGRFARIPLRPEQLKDRLTPAADLFVLAHLGVPYVDEARWSLEIDGLVDRPGRFTLADLRRFPRQEVEAFHQCVGNPLAPTVPQRRIANVVWGGVALRSLLEEVGADESASFIWSYGLDGGEFAGSEVDWYVKDLPLRRVTEGDVLVAYELNGEPLSAEHGFPARLLVPGWYGTNSVKWLWRIQLAGKRADSPFTTVYYNDGPNAPVWAVAPESVIVSPAPGARLDVRAETEAWGWSWAAAGVDRVDVSVDGGTNWLAARVEPRTQWSWQRFSCLLRPSQTGSITLLSRATTADGTTQPAGGARNAVHAVTVVVE